MDKIASDEQFPGQGMSFTAWVQSIIPELDDKDADRVLWECTPFPLSTGYKEFLSPVEEVRDQLASGMTLDEVLDELYRRMDEEMELYESARQLQERVRTVTKDWDLPKRVKIRPIVDVETDLL